MTAIRALDLNIWNYTEPWPARRDLIVDMILDLEPDVVALQEVRYRDWSLDPRHQGDQILAGLPGFDSVWEPAHRWLPGQGHNVGDIEWEGLAILSPHPIVDRALVRLSRSDSDPRDTFQRLVLGALVRTPAGPFWLFNTHFPLSRQARERVAVEVACFCWGTAGDLPFALVGDLNAQPQDTPVRYLTGQVEIDGQHGDLIDAWTARHPDQAGYTFPAWSPSRRIDYVLVSPGIHVQEMAIVGQVPSQDMVSPSDHCGLLAVLQTPGQTRD
jgi:endonuclease/exonuclease/phosphatase family metal-dependent hydrolase